MWDRLIKLAAILYGGFVILYTVAFAGLMYCVLPLYLLQIWLFSHVDSATYWMSSGFLILLIGGVKYYYPKFKKHYQNCPHDISGGETRDLCTECVRIKNLQLLAKGEEMRLYDIKKKADELYYKELNKLKKSQLKKLDYLYSLTPYQFEDAVMNMYRRLGYSVKQTSYSNDRGKDGIAYKDNKKYLIECKRYEISKRIGRPHLQKFFAAMHEEKAVKGFFVTTASFADTAFEYAKANHIELISGKRLTEMMSTAHPENQDDIVAVMCLTCGEIVQFDMMKDSEQRSCKNGHSVRNNISYEHLFKSKLPS